ncbi:MAG: hypothetical protein K8R54_17990 [Bacteroidales bacterium]|nr:hypothetical protein [Bacteroidales bacterium]
MKKYLNFAGIVEKEKEKIYRQLMWDYKISPEEVDKLIKGEAKFAGHYDIDGLFKKTIEIFPWFIVLQIFDINTAKLLLTDKTINKLRFPSLRKNYFYVKNRLHEIIPATR